MPLLYDAKRKVCNLGRFTKPDAFKLYRLSTKVIERFSTSRAAPLHLLTAEDMDAYRAPYLDKHARKPLWRWPNEIPIEGVPAAVTDIVTLNQRYLAHTGIPKLLLYATPGAVIGSSEVAWCKETLSNLTAINLGEGLHFLPEDHPEAIGAALSAWLRSSA